MPTRDPVFEPAALGLGEVGIDIVLTQRVRALLAEHGDTVLARMLTPMELEDCRREGGLDVRSVAGRLAAKEAAFKALATSGTVLPWLGMEVCSAPGGRPVLRLGAAARTLADRAGVAVVRISISHDGDYAVAVAIATLARPEHTGSALEEIHHGHTAAAAQGLDSQASSRA